MRYIAFTENEKAELFDQIAACFYNANFGRMSKADMELMMFRFYIEKLIRSNCNEDGTIDYNKCSDYKISQELGITQQRVRNLKVKNQLANPIEYDWKKALAKLTENARYDKDTHKVMLNIPDPNLYLEIRNFIEERGAYVETQLNPRLLQIRAEYYIAIVIELEPEKSKKKIINVLKRRFANVEKTNVIFDECNIGKTLLDYGVGISEIIANIGGLFTVDNLIGRALISLLKNNC